MVKKVLTKLSLKEITPHQMALGVAFGTLVALLPTFGFSTILAIALISFIPHLSKGAVILGLTFWNPFTQVPIYALSLELGSALYDGGTVSLYQYSILNEVHTYFLRFLLGHLIITILITVLSYLMVYAFRKITFTKKDIELGLV